MCAYVVAVQIDAGNAMFARADVGKVQELASGVQLQCVWRVAFGIFARQQRTNLFQYSINIVLDVRGLYFFKKIPRLQQLCQPNYHAESNQDQQRLSYIYNWYY